VSSVADQPQPPDTADVQQALTAALGSLRREGLAPPAFARLQMERVVAGLQQRTFLWTEVSDFDVFAGRRSSSKIVFRYDGPHRSSFRVGLAWLDAAFPEGRNAYLPDTYGLRTADLVRVLTTWRELAVGSDVDHRASVRSDA